MGVATYFDAAAVAVPVVLGLLGAWQGLRRSLVSWPNRWLLPIVGASAAAMLGALHVLLHWELAAFVYLASAVGVSLVAAIAFLITLVMLVMFLGNLKERVVVWIGGGRIGSVERVFGGFLGIGCGVALVAIPYMLFALIWPDRDDGPGWLRESLSLAYFRSADEAARSALSPYLPPPAGQPRPQR
jgi:hypothetical protein